MRFSCSAVFSTVIGLAASSLLLAQAPAPAKAPAPPPKAPDGFTVLFNGKDLSGWRGRPGGGGVFSPYVEAKFTPEEREAKRKEWNADRDLHWSVDAASGELVSDGKGVHLATEKPYGDFEFRVDWKLMQAERRFRHLPPRFPAGADLGSGECRASRRTAPTRDRAACGTTTRTTPGGSRWSRPTTPSASGTSMIVKMAGTRVWVTLNGKPVVVGQVLDNFFERTQPVLPTGSIELQTHGSEVRFRNIFVREIPAAEAKKLLASVEGK